MPELDEATIFHVARRMDSAEARRHYLRQACGDDRALEARVEALLRVHDEERSFLEPPTPVGDGPLPKDPSAGDGLGTRVGPYTLEARVGEGAFGVVFRAEQQQPMRRTVALKVLKPGLETRQVVARFEAERQALALMDHPNIARVLDGGETASGRPYFVMELVQGVPITEYCDAHRLTPRQRLALFVPVCQAVQHAHQKGIIHRDLKPTNVLVTTGAGKPMPKVIDFGVAKALGQPLTERTLETALGTLVGTLEYMSPEQADFSAADVDTRADVYSLGVLLYELLTGTTPLTRARVRRTPLTETLRLIRQEEPPRPSGRLGEPEVAGDFVSTLRGLEPERLRREVRGELDWIVMKALEKDRARRYETANGLARDLERYLQDEPVEAGPPSAAYRLRKFARKNRNLIGAASAFVLLLAAGTGVSVWQALRATAAEGRSRVAETGEAEQRQQAEDVLNFVLDHVIAAARPEDQPGGLGRNVTLRLALEAALPVVEEQFAERPLVQARLRLTLGTSFWHLGEWKVAAAQLERARALFLEQLGPDHALTLRSTGELATVYADLGHYEKALGLREDTLARQKVTLGPDHPDTLKGMRTLANSYADVNRYEDALRLDREALALAEALFGPDDERTLACLNSLANDYSLLQRLDEALAHYQKVVRLAEARLGPDHVTTLRFTTNLANGYDDLKRYEEARALREKTLPLLRAKLGPQHPDVLTCAFNLANTYGHLERYEDALRLHREVLAARKAKLDPDNHEIIWSMWGEAANLFKLDRGPEAVAVTDEILHRAAALKVQPNLLGLLARRMEYFQKARDAVGCRTTAEGWEKLGRTDPPSVYCAACYRAVTAGVLRGAGASPETARQADAEADRAMAWLRQAVAAGYSKVDNLRTDKDLDALRDRPDFRKLVAKLEAGQEKEKK